MVSGCLTVLGERNMTLQLFVNIEINDLEGAVESYASAPFIKVRTP